MVDFGVVMSHDLSATESRTRSKRAVQKRTSMSKTPKHLDTSKEKILL